MDRDLEALIKIFLQKKERKKFDFFLIEKMGISMGETENVNLELRRKAFYEFRERTEYKCIASLPTMKRWFGINGESVPDRETVFEICFSLGLSVEESESYLKQGIFEPTFQVNDYAEVFYFYGLENGIPYEEVLEMMDAFEDILAERFLEDMEEKTEFGSTSELKKELYAMKKSSKEVFMLWMRDHADWFKGYSRTTQSYLEKLREKISGRNDEEAKKLLELHLSEIGYDQWILHHPTYRKKKKEGIDLFLKGLRRKKKGHLSDEEYKSIKELVHIVYDLRGSNTKLYETLYKPQTGNLPYLSQKHISDLFNHPMHKMFEKELRIAGVRLQKLSETEKCPEDIEVLLWKTGREKEKHYLAGEALTMIRSYQKEHRRRTILLHREDLIPLIYCVTQSEYHEKQELQEKMTLREYFISYGDTILNACGLERINEEYKLDALLLACLDREKEYEYSDILQAVGQMEEERKDESR